MNDSMNDSLNLQDPWIDDSFGNESAEDMQATLSSTLALRKNLSSAFEESAIEMKGDSSKGMGSGSIATAVTVKNSSRPPRPTVTQQSTDCENQKGLSVFLRIRPSKQESTVEVVSSNKIRTHPPISSQTHKSSRQGTEYVKEYYFSNVMPEATSQLEVYDSTSKSMVEGLVDRQKGIGQSGLLFSYGITNAGKTHTVLGNLSQKKENWGLVPRALSDIMDRLPEGAQLSLSYFEIYNEQIFDLLPRETAHKYAVHQPEPLKIADRNGRVIVKDLTKHPVSNLQEGLNLVSQAKQKRTTASNNINHGSSRSHSVCQLTVHSGNATVPVADGTSTETKSNPEASLWIVDLAGSERTKKTASDLNRQKEAASINKSLMTLMRCLSVLRESNEHNTLVVPYRESKLTQLFMGHLTSPSASNTVMIVNIHPGIEEYDETQHVLQYAAASRTITTSDLQNISKSQAVATQVEYGYDGRKKETMAKRVISVLKKLSPKRVTENRKRKNLERIASAGRPTKEKTGLPSEPDAKKIRSIEPSSAVGSSHKEEQSLRMQLATARTENAALATRNHELKNSLNDVEIRIREEVAEEMEQHMEQLRTQYEGTIKQIQQKLQQNASKNSSFDSQGETIEELAGNVRECEDEMNRMREDHYQEMASLRTEHEKLIAKKDEDLASAGKFHQDAKHEEERLKQQIDSQAQELEQIRNELEQSKSEVLSLQEKYVALSQKLQDPTKPDLESAPNEESVGDTRRDAKVVGDQPATLTNCGSDQENKADESKCKSGGGIITSVSPLATLSRNTLHLDSDSSEDSFGPAKWLLPKTKTKRNPKSGLFQRPRGRAPSGVSGWDGRKGAWVVS